MSGSRTGATVDGQAVQLVEDGDGLSWSTAKAGIYGLQLLYDVDAQRYQSGEVLALPVPRAAATAFSLSFPETGVDLSVVPSADLEASERAEVVKFSAGGFRDFTRIAASDPVMWRDIFLENRDSMLEMLQRFSEDLTALQRAIRWGEGEELERRFQRTRDLRRGIIEAHQAGSFDPREPEQIAAEEEEHAGGED